MSTWISRAGVGLGLLLLSACVLETGYEKPRSAPVLDGALNVGVPAGYCIDRAASRSGADTAVILMGRCSDSAAAVPALLSVSVGEAGSAAAMQAGGPAIAKFFTTPQGRAALSRDGRAGDVRVITAVGVKDAFLMHLSDRTVGEYWRGVIGVKGRLVTVSATGAAGLPLPPDQGRKLVDETLEALRSANKTTAG